MAVSTQTQTPRPTSLFYSEDYILVETDTGQTKRGVA